MVLGIAGKYCAGKDLAVSLLEETGFREINEDRIGHTALVEKKSEVLAAFGTVDRKALGGIVFADPIALRRLEQILHPWMVDETRSQVRDAGSQHAMINAAILYRMGLHLLCDLVIVVRAPMVVRVCRGMKRDRLGLFHVLRRVWSQKRDIIPKQFLNERGAPVDTVVVRNGGSPETLKGRLAAILSNNDISGR